MRIALIHNWPNARNSELDIIGRIQRVLTRDGHESTIIDPFGNTLDEEGRPLTETKQINSLDYDFCLNLHYSNPNFLDLFSYVVNWNPYDYLVKDPSSGGLLSDPAINYLANCLRTHDIVLSAGSAKTDQLIVALADRPNPGLMLPDLRFHPTCQIEPDIPPVSLEEFKVFYIGINWERISQSSHPDRRHGGLLERLDQTNLVHFYGVEETCGIRPWEGFRNYKGELPFDNGLSIIRTANQCGVSLVLSSRPHRESGLVSTRIFQACAARTLVISDDNPFIVEHFGDAVLTFEYSSDVAESFDSIKRLIDWVGKNPREAQHKAERAYRIFTERFSLERDMGYLIEHHEIHRELLWDRIMPIDRAQTVDVIYQCIAYNETEIVSFTNNLNRQQNASVHGIVCCSAMDKESIGYQLEKNAKFTYTILACEAGIGSAGTNLLTAVTEYSKGNYFCLYTESSSWYRHHIAYLLRTMQNHDALISQTHLFIRNSVFDTHAYDQSLGQLALSGGLTMFGLSHLIKHEVSSFAPCSFLFHKKLLINNLAVCQNLRLFDISVYFFLLYINYTIYKTLPYSSARISYSRDRNDAWFALYDFDDQLLSLRLREERALLEVMMNNNPACRELVAIGRAAQLEPQAPVVTTGTGQVYRFLLGAFRNRPLLRRMSIRLYDLARILLRLPPNPPKIS